MAFDSRMLKFGLIVALLVRPGSILAQDSIAPSGSNVKIAQCDGLGKNLLHRELIPDSSDCSGFFNNYFPGVDVSGLNSISCSGNTFSATTSGTGATAYVFSPKPCGSYETMAAFGDESRWGPAINFDSGKYTQFVARFYTDTRDDLGYRLIFDRSCNYANDRSVTTPLPILPGWQTLSLDMTTASLDSGANTTSWTGADVTGFAVMPSVTSGANVKYSWIDIQDPTSCGSTSLSYSATTSGSDNLVSIFLDDDSNPFNGYWKRLLTAAPASGGSSYTVNSLAVKPGSYNAVLVKTSDYPTLLGEPINFDSNQVLVTSGLTGSLGSGAFSGQTTSTGANVYIKLPGGLIPSTYSKISFRLPRNSVATPVRLIWSGTSGTGFADLNESYNVGDSTYQLDLSGDTSWTGNITTFIVRPSTVSGTSFSLDFISFRNQGFTTSLNSSTLAAAATVSSSYIIVNDKPYGTFTSPSAEGGLRVKAGDMNPGDLVTFSGLTATEDSGNSGEYLSTWLPDVREVGGVRGDFWKGTNPPTTDDPINYMLFTSANSSPTIDASEYHHICIDSYLDTAFDLGAGSVGRITWAAAGDSFKTSEDLVLGFNGWKSTSSNRGWYRACMDMNDVPLEDAAPSWSGTIDKLRFDPHEFPSQVTFYMDRFFVAKDMQSPGLVTLQVNAYDSDDDATVSYYYRSSPGTTAGTLIGTSTEGQDPYYLWNTASLPSGTYYLYAVLADGTNSTTIQARSPIVVTNSSTYGSDPILSLESPLAGQAICDSLQLKGYALQPDRLETVPVVSIKIDGDLLGSIRPSLYSVAGRSTYPIALSNSGFDTFYDVSLFSTGSHAVEVSAVSSDGRITTSSFSITKQPSGCDNPISDPDPAGTPVSQSLSSQIGDMSLKTSYSSKTKKFIISAGNLTNDCYLSLLAGASNPPTTEILGETRVTGELRRVKYTASKIKAVNGKAYTKFKATLRCGEDSVTKSRTSGQKVTSAKKIKQNKKNVSGLLKRLTKGKVSQS